MRIESLCHRCLGQGLTQYGRLFTCSCGFYQIEDSWQLKHKVKETDYWRYKLSKKWVG